jgi:hypothetical protein
MQHLANIILKDYSLTTKVLRTANSFHYNRVGTPVVSITQAMVLLGIDTVRDLARSLIVFEHYQGKSAGVKELMVLSLLTASHARETAVQVGYARPEEAHLHGMFRNLGEVLVSCHAPEDYAAVLARMEKSRVRVAEACLAVLGFTYEEVAEAVCRLWGIVPQPQGPRSDERKWLDAIVAFGHELTTSVYRRGGGDSPATLSSLMLKHGTALGLTPDVLRTLLERGIGDTKEVFDSLGVSINDLSLRRQSKAALAGLVADAGNAPAPTVSEPEPAAGPSARDRIVEAIEATMAAATPFDLNQTLLTILEAVLRAGPFDRAIFCLLSGDRTEIVGRFGLGHDVETRLPRTRFALSLARHAAPAGPALLRGADLVITSAQGRAGEEAQLLQRLGVHMMGLLPVSVDGKLVGALYVDRLRPQPAADAATLAFLGRARALARRAIEQARAGGEPMRRPTVTPGQRYDAVLRLLKGEAIEVVSQELAVSSAEIERWRDAFLAGAMTGLEDREAGG